MSSVVATQPPSSAARHRPWLLTWAIALSATLVLYVLRDTWPWALSYPREWTIPLRYWISDFMKWLVNDLDLGFFTFKEFTRSIAWLLSWPLLTAEGLLASGFEIPVSDERVLAIPRLSWLAVKFIWTT